MTKLCHRYFNVDRCFWEQDTKKPIQEQIEFCRKVKCPHGSVTFKTLSNGQTVHFVSCDLTWNPMSWEPTTEEEAKEMEILA